MLIDKKTYAVKEHNRHKVKSAKTQIVIATSLRKNNYHITRLLHKDFGNSKNWSTYSINRNGTVFQHFDMKFHSNFLGIKEADKKSISIVLENMGCLFKSPNGKYINWLNEECDEENIINKKWLGYNYWEKFTKEQLESLVLLCREICEKHNIPKVCIDFHHYHKDTLKFRGIVFRSNYIEDSSDINPLFNISEFNEMLRNEFI
jgi:N-acetyl-anhydromuramyl-L-alanine amidase AmpD